MNADDEKFEAIDYLIGQLRDLLEAGRTYHKAVAQLKKTCLPDLLEEALKQFENLQLANEPGNGAVIRGLGAAKPWYPGPRHNHHYWPALRKHLLDTNWSPQDVAELDEASNIVLASCQSPWETSSAGRGMVVGYVQSGKTTNFTAVIAKAADAGFRLVIVLSGLTKSLRRQTQVRLNEQLKDLSPLSWVFLTDEDRDFDRATGVIPVLFNPSLRTCIVIKKNTSRLKKLNRFLDDAARTGQLANCPILIIDDEGDQASLSPNCDQTKATRVNKEIVKILDRPRVNYISYTATPFANVFVNPFHEENLYPRDFIYPMKETKGYFGSRLMFGSDVDRGGLNVVREISYLEEDNFVGVDAPKRSDSLSVAIQWFLMAATARRIRENGIQPHTTMLINASERVQYHFEMWKVVRDTVQEIQQRMANDASLKIELESLWNSEMELVNPQQFGLEKLPFDHIWAELGQTIVLLGPLTGTNHDSNPECGIVVDNSGAEVRLAYSDARPRPIIVIGGSTLSRGLTLEGLVCSVFARSTKLYDSLLQMGRWFGYRRGYEDLPRVWMFNEVFERFEFLARVELEIRDEIQRYAESNLSPIDFGLRIRMHPGMSITRQAMMKGANRVKFDFSGARPQTTFLENLREKIDRSYTATNKLVAGLISSDYERTIVTNGTLFRNVSGSHIRSFFDSNDGYLLSASNEYFNNDPLCKYIDLKNSKGEIQNWNVVFYSIKGSRNTPSVENVNMGVVRRSRLKTKTEDGTISIGSLTDPGDKYLDVPAKQKDREDRYRDESGIPLLVIYAIDKDSKPGKNAQNRRSDLNAIDDLIATAIYFPISDQLDDLGEFAVVHGPWDIPPIGDDDDTIEDEISDDEGDAETEHFNVV